MNIDELTKINRSSTERFFHKMGEGQIIDEKAVVYFV